MASGARASPITCCLDVNVIVTCHLKLSRMMSGAKRKKAFSAAIKVGVQNRISVNPGDVKDGSTYPKAHIQINSCTFKQNHMPTFEHTTLLLKCRAPQLLNPPPFCLARGHCHFALPVYKPPDPVPTKVAPKPQKANKQAAKRTRNTRPDAQDETARGRLVKRVTKKKMRTLCINPPVDEPDQSTCHFALQGNISRPPNATDITMGGGG